MLGAVPRGDGSVSFAVWAPAARSVAVRAHGREFPLEERADGFFEATLPLAAGADYRFLLDGERALSDPCARRQPRGVEGPSQIHDPGSFTWSDDERQPLDPDTLVVYELHVGAFSRPGTFDGAVEHLPALKELGVTAIELMPVATFPGNRNWGYDGVYTYAPHEAYGGPDGLCRLVDAAHGLGLGVVLDVVYNHVGPGADLRAFGPYFSQHETTFWGDAFDYRRPGVREWAIQNAEMWVRDYHVDGLRLDATHAVFDDSRPHVLEELATRVRAIDARTLVIAEMEAGDLRPIREWGHDAQWADEFHHVLHVLLTGERDGYYAAYEPSVTKLAEQIRRQPSDRLVVCSQNHDQVGNRAFGDRPSLGERRLRAAALLFAPQIPLLFMGEEYGEQRPFRFFTDHTDPAIAEATRTGRRREFERFTSFAADDLPDPQDLATFESSKLDRAAADAGVLELHRELLALRRRLPEHVEAEADETRRFLRLRRGDHELSLNFSEHLHDGVPPRDIRLRST